MKLIIITWRANSGKTTLANYISEHYWIKRISASDYTKSLSKWNSRKELESIFNKIVNNKWFDYLAEETLEFWFTNLNIWIIDWPRHYKFVKALKSNLWKNNCLCIWIGLDFKNRFNLAQKAKRVEAKTFETFLKYEKKSSHELYADEVVKKSDIIIWDELILNKSDIFEKIIKDIDIFMKK